MLKKDLFASAGYLPMLGETQFGLRRPWMPTFAPDDGGAGGGSDAGAGAGNDGAGDGDTQSGTQPNNEPANQPKLSDAEAKLLKEVMASKQKLKDTDAALKSAQEALKRFEGIDPEQVKALVAAQKTAEEEALKKAGEWDKLRQRMANEHQREMETLRQQLAAREAAEQQRTADMQRLALQSAFRGSSMVTQETVLTADKAHKLYGDYFEVEDGEVIGYDAPRGAARRTQLVDGRGLALGFDEAMRRIIESDPDRDHLLRSRRNAGSGVTNQPHLQPNQRSQNEQVSGIGRIAMALKSGQLKKAE